MEHEKLKNLYKDLCKYKFFDYYSVNYKYGKTDKTTKWVYYDNNKNLNILVFDQINNKNPIDNICVDIIERNLYILKNVNSLKYEKITNIYEFTEEIKDYLHDMTINYNININNLTEIQNIIGKYNYKDIKSVNWTLYSSKKTIEYIKINMNLFLNNTEQNNIQITIKNTNKNEKIEYYNTEKLIIYLKKLSNNLILIREKQSILTKQNQEDNTPISLNKENIKYEIRPRNEISTEYKNLFIKSRYINRFCVQSGKYKYEILEKKF